MSDLTDPILQQAIDRLAVPRIAIGHRLIQPSDANALLDTEKESFKDRSTLALRASGAARIVGRHLLAQMGLRDCILPRSASGAPIWPPGIVGAFAHDDRVAVAAIGTRRDYRAVGIDVEAAIPLPHEMIDLVATPREMERLDDDSWSGRLLFTVKEAVYKAIHPLDDMFLDFQDIEVDLSRGVAITRHGRTLRFKTGITSHLVAIATA